MKVTLMAHQLEAYEWLRDRAFGALFYETGTGKTLITLESIKNWHRQGRQKTVVVVPNTLTGVWIDEAAKWDFPLNMIRLEGTGDQRARIVQRGNWDVCVVNYESLRSPVVADALSNCKPEVLIYDEVQRLKNRRAIQTTMCREIATAVQAESGVVVGLTGTPVIHSPLDLWSEFDVMAPSPFPRKHPLGYGSFQSFEVAIAKVIPHPHIRGIKIYTFYDEALAELKERVSHLAIEKSKADCLDLPERHFYPVTLDMTPVQAKVYDALSDDYIATLEDIVPNAKLSSVLSEYNLSPLRTNEKAMKMYEDIQAEEDGQEQLFVSKEDRISVNFSHTLITRLQQIAAGHIKADDGTVHFIKGCKQEWLEENLPVMTSKGWNHKAALFCRFIADVELLERICDDLKIGYVSLSGKNSQHAAKIVAKFQTDPEVRAFIGNIAVASTGITLTAADRVIFYDNSYAWGDRVQAEDRTYRIGQTRVVEYYDLIANNSVDEEVMKNQTEKSDLAVKSVKGLLSILKKANQ